MSLESYLQNLTSKQKLAIPMIVGGRTGKEVAIAINCNPATISQWLNHDENFNQALEHYSQIILCKAQQQLDLLTTIAVDELRTIILNGQSDQVKLKAIELVINSVGLGQIDRNPKSSKGKQFTTEYDLDKLVEVLGHETKV